jgi:hypothetical protein
MISHEIYSYIQVSAKPQMYILGSLQLFISRVFPLNP